MKLEARLAQTINKTTNTILIRLLGSALVYRKISNINAWNKSMNIINIHTDSSHSPYCRHNKQHCKLMLHSRYASYSPHCKQDTHSITHTAVKTRILYPTLLSRYASYSPHCRQDTHSITHTAGRIHILQSTMQSRHASCSPHCSHYAYLGPLLIPSSESR